MGRIGRYPTPIRDFKGVWVPKEIWLEENLGWSEKLMLVEIDSLATNGECFASNDYFAMFFGLSKGRVSKIISHLSEMSYIEVHLERDDTGNIVKRTITTKGWKLWQTTRPMAEKNHTPIDENDHTPMVENSQYINTSIINTKSICKTSTKIRELFKEMRSDYYHDGKEAKACKLLESRYESDIEGFTERLRAYREMTRTDKFFSTQPFSPSAFNCYWNRIIVKTPTPSSAAPLPVESWEDYIYRIRRELADAGYEVGDITLDSELDALYSKHQKKIRNGRF